MTKTSKEEVVLDHTDRIVLSVEEATQHYDARQALARLGEGLSWVYGTVLEMEHRARAVATREKVDVQIAGPILDALPIGLLSCAFQWYAVSACNYAQLV